MSLAVLKISGNIWRVATSTYNILQNLTASSVPCPRSLSLFMAQPPAVQIFFGAPHSSAAGANKGHTCQHVKHAHLMLQLCTRQQPNDTQQPWCLGSEHLQLHPDRVASWSLLRENNLWQTYLYCMCIYKCMYIYIYICIHIHCKPESQ